MSKIKELQQQIELASITTSKLALLLVEKGLITKDEWKACVDQAFKEMET